ncbi:substrate-binding periplasmic protein [Kiloniella sp.]|uniref:substrate-binding periplasmic protein n=1 Tax=Kiloniella sp. TaxID=1938587 RepID=UPI003B01748A
MSKFFCLLIFVILFSTKAYAKEIRIVATDYPPHVIEAQKSGMDLEILRSVLHEMGYSSTVKFVPTRRAMNMVEHGAADVTVPAFFEEDREGYYTSNAIIDYKPTVFTLSKNSHSLDGLSSLTAHKVVTFIGAAGYFGSEFTNATDKAVSYNEINNVDAMPDLLMMERYSAVVLDENIFYYFYRKKDKNRDLTVFDAHHVFPKIEASVGFHDQSVRDAFNEYLAKFRTAGKDKKIIEKYVGVAR